MRTHSGTWGRREGRFILEGEPALVSGEEDLSSSTQVFSTGRQGALL